MIRKLPYILILLLVVVSVGYAQTGAFDSRSRLLKSVSQKELVETARSHDWALDFTKRGADTVHIIALRVEFQPDTSALTTGNGRFGMRGDTKEQRFYHQDTVYKYDRLAHDSLYFAHQLTALKNYYGKVSRGNLTLDFTVYPSGRGEIGFAVPNQMIHYSPGWRKKREKTDEYWDRKTHGLMMFIKDAILTANNTPDSPFKNLVRDDAGVLRVLKSDGTPGNKAVVLILHAGASYLTDGGLTGDVDSPSDMIDAFIDHDFFKYFKDTLGLEENGVSVIGHGGGTITIDEVMMCAETSNQDGLNWGIQGVLVNQMARQLGIPDLFSTASGVSAVGAFCIMDFAGYSAGQGFIPPYPSAWVRAFMGWDKPVAVGAGGQYNVKALTSVLDRANGANTPVNDTTILLVPINSNEYYLIENRQRNLTGERSLFVYDERNDDLINAYPFNVNIGNNVKTFSGTESNVILETKNNDVSLPASGVLVWHVDERVIRQKLAYNFINADSSYRGVRLVEADGVNDLGVMFVDAFYQAAFDYGGAEDVFPHKTTDRYDNKKVISVNGFGPHTKPSTRANDGGHTYLQFEFTGANGRLQIEKSQNIQGDIVENYSDSVFVVNVKHDPNTHIVPGWPRRAAPEEFFDPLITPINASSSSTATDTVLALLSKSGRLYLYSVNKYHVYGDKTTQVKPIDYYGNAVDAPANVTFFDSIPGTYTFPTAIGGRIYIPSSHKELHVINIYNSADLNDRITIPLPAKPSSYVCGIGGDQWAVGLVDGRVIIGDGITAKDETSLPGTVTKSAKRTDKNALKKSAASGSPVSAIAAIGSAFVTMQNDGRLSFMDGSAPMASSQVIRNFLPPFKLAVGNSDNNKDGMINIVVTDSRQGVWVFSLAQKPSPGSITSPNGTTVTIAGSWELNLAPGWQPTPNDWANTYCVDPKSKDGRCRDRNRYPVNFSAPALADISRDGTLDIVIGGTNGVYALNRKGALLSRWPAYLDNRYWYERGCVASSPIIVSSNNNQPLVLFSSPTGENATFNIVKIETADKARGVVTFKREDGTIDSLWGLSASTIDTILTLGDSLIYPYILPGGFVDALDASAARPMEQIGSWRVPQSRWPLTTGAPVTTSPLAYRTSPNGTPDLFAVSSDGMVYRWKLTGMLSNGSAPLAWPQTGFDAARSFAFGGAPTSADDIITEKEPLTFWNYPNPTVKDDAHTTFKYKFNGQAKNVRLDIHTITGKRVDSFKNLSGDFPGWNEHRVSLRKYGPGVYRCRMEATINGKKYSKFWKMAVVK